MKLQLKTVWESKIQGVERLLAGGISTVPYIHTPLPVLRLEQERNKMEFKGTLGPEELGVGKLEWLLSLGLQPS